MSRGIALIGRLAVPLHCLGIVLWDAPAEGVHVPKAGLGVSMALLGKWSQKPHRTRIVTARIGCNRFLIWARISGVDDGNRENDCA